MAIYDRIDTFVFLELKGPPARPKDVLKVIQRSGVDGTAFLNIGNRGREFNVMSKVDVASMGAGEQLMANYKSLISSGPVVYMQGGVESTTYGWWVKVVSVQQQDLHAVGRLIGGINPPSLAMLTTSWTLVALQYTQP